MLMIERKSVFTRANQLSDFFFSFCSALTVFVVPIESLKATSLIHAGKFSKLLNTTTTSPAPSSSSEEPAKSALQEMLAEMPDDDVSF